MGVQVIFKERNIIRNHLVALKDNDNFTIKSGMICRFRCTKTGCEEEYIGEAGRSFGDRLKEHLRVPSHTNMTTLQDIASMWTVAQHYKDH